MYLIPISRQFVKICLSITVRPNNGRWICENFRHTNICKVLLFKIQVFRIKKYFFLQTLVYESFSLFFEDALLPNAIRLTTSAAKKNPKVPVK